MNDIHVICDLVSSGIIKRISYSFEVNIDIERTEFRPIIEGDGWLYFPIEERPNEHNKILVPDEVINVFNKGYFCLFFYKQNKYFFDRLFCALKNRGFPVKMWCDPTKEECYNACGKMVAE